MAKPTAGDRGPWALAGALGVCCLGLPLLVVGYVFSRRARRR